MSGASELTEKLLTSPAAGRAVTRVSPCYGESATALAFFQTAGVQADEMRGWVEKFQSQIIPQEASWLLRCWEQEYGIEPDPDADMETRRARVLSRMRDRAPMNPAKLERLAAAASSPDTAVSILENTAKNRFDLEMEPPVDAARKKRIRAAVDQRKPAHVFYLMRQRLPLNVQEEEKFTPALLKIRARINNYFMKPIRLNGSHKLDGTWLLDQQIKGRYQLKNLEIRQGMENAQSARETPQVRMRAKERSGARMAAGLADGIQNSERIRANHIQVQMDAQNRNSFDTKLINDTMWVLDGAYMLDGVRRINADITEEEL